MSTVFFGVLVISVAVVLAIAGLFLVQRLVPSALRQEHNDVAGFIYAVLGVAYAVLLAFVVIAVWDDFEASREEVDHEASELAEIYWLANQLPEPERVRLQELTRAYARAVIDEEWPLMVDGRSSPRAWALLYEMQSSIGGFEPRTEADQVLYDQEISRAHELADARRLRLLDANQGIPGVLWVGLVVGGVITVSFTYLFGLKNSWSHTLMIAALTVLISFILFTIYSLEYPFSRGIRLQPEAFEMVLQRFGGTPK